MKNKLDTILLVDDDPISNFITEETIREKGLLRSQLLTVADGRQALAYLQQLFVDGSPENGQEKNVLVLLDLSMPVMDGFEFLEELQTQLFRQGLIVAVLTSSDHQRDMNLAEKYDIAAYLQKPVSPEDLGELFGKYFY